MRNELKDDVIYMFKSMVYALKNFDKHEIEKS